MKRIILSIGAVVATAVAVQAQPLFPTGCSFDQALHNKVPKSAPLRTRNYVTTPERVSLKQFCPKPRNQNPYNTCVGWSTAYAANSIIEAIATGSTEQASTTEKAFSPTYVYNQIRQAEGDCMAPAYIHEGMEVLQKGCARMADVPFDCDLEITEDMKVKVAETSTVSPYSIDGYKSLAPYQEFGINEIQAIKRSVADRNPVIVAFKCFDSFMKVGADGIWNGAEDKQYGYHALTIVGYDDKVNGGSFEIMNSWGTGWANKGFVWVSYKDMEKHCAGAYALIWSDKAKTAKLDGKVTTLAADQVLLGGEIKFFRDSDQEMKAVYDPNSRMFRMSEGYHSGTRFRVFVKNDESAYVYVIGADQTQKTFQLFPHADDVSPSLSKDNEVALPSDNAFITMDNTVGKDYICVMYSKKLLNLDEIRAKMEAAPGTFNEKVKAALGARYVDGSDKMDVSKKGIALKAACNKTDILTLIVETEHLK